MQGRNLGMRSAETQKKLRNFIKDIADICPPAPTCSLLPPPTPAISTELPHKEQASEESIGSKRGPSSTAFWSKRPRDQGTGHSTIMFLQEAKTLRLSTGSRSTATWSSGLVTRPLSLQNFNRLASIENHLRESYCQENSSSCEYKLVIAQNLEQTRHCETHTSKNQGPIAVS